MLGYSFQIETKQFIDDLEISRREFIYHGIQINIKVHRKSTSEINFILRYMTTNKTYSNHSTNKYYVSAQPHTSQSIKRELQKIKMYFERDNYCLPSSLDSQNNELTPYLSSPPQSNSEYLGKCAQKINDQMITQNKRLKNRLKREKQFRKQINQALKQQNQMLQTLSNNLIPIPPPETVKSPEKQATCEFHEIFTCQKPKIEARHLLRELYKQNQKAQEIQEITNLNKYYSRTKSVSKKSLNQEVLQKKKKRKCSYQPSTMAEPSEFIQPSKQQSTFISPSRQPSISEKSSLEGNRFSDQDFLELLSNKLLALMRKSQKEQSRTKKLKIRQEIGEVITQIKNLKEHFEQNQRPIMETTNYGCRPQTY